VNSLRDNFFPLICFFFRSSAFLFPPTKQIGSILTLRRLAAPPLTPRIRDKVLVSERLAVLSMHGICGSSLSDTFFFDFDVLSFLSL